MTAVDGGSDPLSEVAMSCNLVHLNPVQLSCGVKRVDGDSGPSSATKVNHPIRPKIPIKELEIDIFQ